MADQTIGLDKGDLGRLERGTAKAEKAGADLGKGAAAATRFAERVLHRLGDLVKRSESFLEGTGFEGVARQVSERALGAVSGARAGAALFGAIPLPGSGALGAVVGGALGEELAGKIDAGRIEGERRALEVQNAAVLRGRALESLEAAAETRFNERQAAEAWLAATKARTVDLGLGDPARLAALRRAAGGGR